MSKTISTQSTAECTKSAQIFGDSCILVLAIRVNQACAPGENSGRTETVVKWRCDVRSFENLAIALDSLADYLCETRPHLDRLRRHGWELEARCYIAIEEDVYLEPRLQNALADICMPIRFLRSSQATPYMRFSTP